MEIDKSINIHEQKIITFLQSQQKINLNPIPFLMLGRDTPTEQILHTAGFIDQEINQFTKFIDTYNENHKELFDKLFQNIKQVINSKI